MSESEVKILEKTQLYKGFFTLEQFTLQHTLFAGGWSKPLKRELFRRGTCVAVLLYDPELDRVVMIEQFRMGAMLHVEHPWLLEIVAGAIEEGETAEEVAYREAWEEAGCEILELTQIQKFFTTPGGSSEWLTLFYGRVNSSNIGGIHGLAEEHEDIRVTTLSFQEVYDLLIAGTIHSAIPIIAIQWLYIHRDQLRQPYIS